MFGSPKFFLYFVLFQQKEPFFKSNVSLHGQRYGWIEFWWNLHHSNPLTMREPNIFFEAYHYVSHVWVLAKCLKSMVQKCPLMSKNEHLMRYNCSFNLLTRKDGFAEPSLTSFAVSCCFSTTFLRRNLGRGTHLLDPLIGGPASTDFSHGAVTAEGEIRLHTLSSFSAPWMKSLTSWNFDRMVFESSLVQGFVLILPKSCLFQSSFWAIFGDVGTTFNSPFFDKHLW